MSIQVLMRHPYFDSLPEVDLFKELSFSLEDIINSSPSSINRDTLVKKAISKLFDVKYNAITNFAINKLNGSQRIISFEIRDEDYPGVVVLYTIN